MIYVESLFSRFSDVLSLLGKAKSGAEEEKERVSAPESDSAVILALCHEKLRVRRELRECFQRKIYRCREPFLSFTI